MGWRWGWGWGWQYRRSVSYECLIIGKIHIGGVIDTDRVRDSIREVNHIPFQVALLFHIARYTIAKQQTSDGDGDGDGDGNGDGNGDGEGMIFDVHTWLVV